jgi:uncharacterized protein YggE
MPSHVRCRALVALLLLPLARPASLPAQAAGTSAGGPYVETVGTAESRVVPDRATLTLTVETKGAGAGAAASANAALQSAVLDTLAKLGLRAPEVSTQRFNVAPNYEAGPQGRSQEGYLARNSVIVRISDLTRIGPIIDAALARGATGVGNLEFTSSAADSVTRVATRLAVTKARAQAEAMAAALGGELGPLLHATTAANEVRFAIAAASSRLGNTPITPAEVVIAASVLTRWQFVARR